jgi:hypothetical protein
MGSTIPLFSASWVVAHASALEFREETSTFGLQERQNLHDTRVTTYLVRSIWLVSAGPGITYAQSSSERRTYTTVEILPRTIFTVAMRNNKIGMDAEGHANAAVR